MIKRTLLLSILFLMSSCASAPPAPVTPIHWDYYEPMEGKVLACLSVDDVKVVTERLVRCKQAAKK